MAFVMPAGDYERALRLAGASNFMEAFEAGQDRALRRKAARDQMRRSEELFNRQLEDQDAPLMSPVDMAPSDVTMEVTSLGAISTGDMSGASWSSS